MTPAPPTTFAGLIDPTRHRYFDHPYNVTAENERAVEVPIALDFLDRHPGSVVEVGNVLSHYRRRRDGHLVVDLHEQDRGVENADVRTWMPPGPPDVVVSISTVEHVGYDQAFPAPSDSVACIARLAGWNPQGAVLLSFPFGHNLELDRQVAHRHPAVAGLAEAVYYRSRRTDSWQRFDGWDRCSTDERHDLIAGWPYDRGTPSARAVWVGWREPTPS